MNQEAQILEFPRQSPLQNQNQNLAEELLELQRINRAVFQIHAIAEQKYLDVILRIAATVTEKGDPTLKLILALVIALTATAVHAQDFPKLEVFGGYAATSIEGEESAGIDRQYFHGWGASITNNFSPWMGLALHAGGAYGTIDVGTVDVDTTAHAFLVGPEFSVRSGAVRVFAHTLLGFTAARASAAGNSESSSDFTWAVGGGIDAGRGRLAARVIQFDWLRIHSDRVTNNFRVSAGLVGRF